MIHEIDDPILKEQLQEIKDAVREHFKGRTFLRVYEVAEFLGLSTKRVYTLIEQGYLDAMRITNAKGRGARLRITVGDLIRYLQERRIESF